MSQARLRQRNRCLHCREAFRGAAVEVMFCDGRPSRRAWRWYAVNLCAGCAEVLESSVAPAPAEQLLERQHQVEGELQELACVAAYHRWQGSPWNHLG